MTIIHHLLLFLPAAFSFLIYTFNFAPPHSTASTSPTRVSVEASKCCPSLTDPIELCAMLCCTVFGVVGDLSYFCGSSLCFRSTQQRQQLFIMAARVIRRSVKASDPYPYRQFTIATAKLDLRVTRQKRDATRAGSLGRKELCALEYGRITSSGREKVLRAFELFRDHGCAIVFIINRLNETALTCHDSYHGQTP